MKLPFEPFCFFITPTPQKSLYMCLPTVSCIPTIQNIFSESKCKPYIIILHYHSAMDYRFLAHIVVYDFGHRFIFSNCFCTKYILFPLSWMIMMCSLAVIWIVCLSLSQPSWLAIMAVACRYVFLHKHKIGLTGWRLVVVSVCVFNTIAKMTFSKNWLQNKKI